AGVFMAGHLREPPVLLHAPTQAGDIALVDAEGLAQLCLGGLGARRALVEEELKGVGLGGQERLSARRAGRAEQPKAPHEALDGTTKLTRLGLCCHESPSMVRVSCERN